MISGVICSSISVFWTETTRGGRAPNISLDGFLHERSFLATARRLRSGKIRASTKHNVSRTDKSLQGIQPEGAYARTIWLFGEKLTTAGAINRFNETDSPAGAAIWARDSFKGAHAELGGPSWSGGWATYWRHTGRARRPQPRISPPLGREAREQIIAVVH
jgi:hypothetical protein